MNEAESNLKGRWKTGTAIPQQCAEVASGGEETRRLTVVRLRRPQLSA